MRRIFTSAQTFRFYTATSGSILVAVQEHYQIDLPSGACVQISLNLQSAKTAESLHDCATIRVSRPPTFRDFQYLNDWVLGVASEVAKHANRRICWSIGAGDGVSENQIWACYPDGRREQVIPTPPKSPTTSRTKIKVSGNSKELIALSNQLTSLAGVRVATFSDPAEHNTTPSEMTQIFSGKPLRIGITSLSVEFGPEHREAVNRTIQAYAGVQVSEQ